jgi:hypothetical protein
VCVQRALVDIITRGAAACETSVASARDRARRVGTLGLADGAVVYAKCALVFVTAANAAAGVAQIARARERTRGIHTHGILVAVMRVECTFVDRHACETVTVITVVTGASKRTSVVETRSSSGTVVEVA